MFTTKINAERQIFYYKTAKLINLFIIIMKGTRILYNSKMFSELNEIDHY
jgi:hypothetical protein